MPSPLPPPPPPLLGPSPLRSKEGCGGVWGTEPAAVEAKGLPPKMEPEPEPEPEPDMCPAVIFPEPENSRRAVGGSLSKSISARLLLPLRFLPWELLLLLVLPTLSLSLRPKPPLLLPRFMLSAAVTELKLSRTSRLSSLMAIPPSLSRGFCCCCDCDCGCCCVCSTCWGC